MTMLITKFNKLIANKFVWIGFTFIIVISFAFLGVAGSGEARDASARQAAGTLFGKTVSAQEFRKAYVHTYLGLTLAIGQSINITKEIDRELDDMAWVRLASLKKADRMGLRTSGKEVVDAIRNHEGFQQDGRFSRDMYQMFVTQYLTQLGFSAGQFEEYIAEEIVLQKLQRMVMDTVLVAPAEVERAIRIFGDEFTVQHVRVGSAALDEVPAVDDAAVQTFFEQHAERFATPAQVQVRFVRFPVARFLEEIEITEEQALAHYDVNIDQYMRLEDAALEGDEDAADKELFQISTTIPFEEVREEIKDILRRDLAGQRTADVAMDFVVALLPDREGRAPSFEEAAERFEVEVERVAPFARGEIPEGIDAGTEFNRAAFDLRPNPEHYFSDLVQGEDYLYVLALEERIPERIPALAEVEQRVRAAANREARQQALEVWAKQFRSDATARLADGETFETVVTGRGLVIEPEVSFSAATGLEEDIPYGDDLLRTVLAHNEGEVSEPFSWGGQYIVAYVARREAADLSAFAGFRSQIAQSLQRDRGRILFEEWQQQLLAEAGLERRTSRRDEDEL